MRNGEQASTSAVDWSQLVLRRRRMIRSCGSGQRAGVHEVPVCCSYFEVHVGSPPSLAFWSGTGSFADPGRVKYTSVITSRK